MQNLHLKNLKNTEPIDLYVNKIRKIFRQKDKFNELVTLLNKLYTYIGKEIESINIIDPNIQKFKEHLIEYIGDIQEYELKYPKTHLHSITRYYSITKMLKRDIETLKLLKNIKINSKMINIKNIHNYDVNDCINNTVFDIINQLSGLKVFDTLNHVSHISRNVIIFTDKNNIIKKITTDWFY